MNRFSLLLFGCISSLFFFSFCNSTDDDPPLILSDKAIVLTNGILFNGVSLLPASNGMVAIEDGKIIYAGPRKSFSSSAKVYDVQGGSILPGVINSHVHNAYSITRLTTWAYNGVTTVRDEGILSTRPLEELIELRNNAAENPNLARLVSAGYIMTVPNGYGQMYVATVEEARDKVLEQLNKGVDLIKISQEDGYAGKSGLPKLSNEQMSAIINAAHGRGKLVSGHATQALYWDVLANAAVDDIAHICWDAVSSSTISKMIKKNIYLVPTFTVFRNYNSNMPACIDNLRMVVQNGGKIALGNDFGGGPGNFEDGIPMYEIECMSSAGMMPMQIITAATLNGAHVCGLEDKLGSLEEGKIADVIVLKDNPLKDLNAFKTLKMVIHSGVIIRNEL
jgi:imidazolonepropionase-like amidohydrolase